MTLCKRLPRLRWKPSQAQAEVIPPDVRTQCPELATDLRLLAEELLPHCRELDAHALRFQNKFRLEQVLLIFGGALATILGGRCMPAWGHCVRAWGAVWIGITESVLSAVAIL